MISGSGGYQNPHLVTVAELLDAPMPLCCAPGPAYSRCTRSDGHAPPCAALGTDGKGAPVVQTWYRPSTDSWPLSGGRPDDLITPEPGA